VKQEPITAATADEHEETVMEQERRIQKQDEQTEVEGHRIGLNADGQVAEGEQRYAFEPAERRIARDEDAEGPEVEGHRLRFFGPAESQDPGRMSL
jgi:hypothetical protein